MNENRQPRGIPVGGQFAAAHHQEASLALETPKRQRRKRLTPEKREELLRQRREASAQLDAEDINDAAKAVRKWWPDAHSIVVHRAAGIESNLNPNAVEIWIETPKGRVTFGPRAGLRQVGNLRLIPEQFEESPLAPCRKRHHNGPRFFCYDLEKMATLTPEEILEHHE